MQVEKEKERINRESAKFNKESSKNQKDSLNAFSKVKENEPEEVKDNSSDLSFEVPAEHSDQSQSLFRPYLYAEMYHSASQMAR